MNTVIHKKIVSFEDLDVFQRAYRVSLEIHRVTFGFPKVEQFALAQQMRRASKSIVANIAEGYGKQKQSMQEFRRFLYMAVGSAEEMRVWLRYALDLDYISLIQWQAWRDEYLELVKMLQGFINKLPKVNSMR